MNRRSLLSLPFFAGLLGLAGCARTLGTYRYRVTVEVQTPQGPRSGSSVMEVVYGQQQVPGNPGWSARIEYKGEAVYVDLGAGRYVVALLNTGRLDPLQALFRQLGWGFASLKELEKGGKLSGKVELKGGEIPTMVTFTNPADPTSFKIVYQTKFNRQYPQNDESRRRHVEVIVGPEIVQNNFASLFGPGYALKSVTLEIVDPKTPVTRWVTQKLQWIDDPKYTKNPGWMQLSEEVRSIFTSLRFFER